MNKQTIDKFLGLYSQLLVHDLRQRLGIGEAVHAFDDADSRILIHVASCLALGPTTADEMTEALWKKWAYDVATRLAEHRASGDLRYCKAAEMILARIGNFPGREFLHEKLGSNAQDETYPAALAIEALTHEAENTIEFRGLGPRVLTDFQVKLVESLRSSRPISVSAPTSAGKSYVLSLDIVDAFAAKAGQTIVYVVPTRALIRQVMTDLLDRLREAKMPEVAVSGAPVPLGEAQHAKGVVYVLTQERLMSLLYSQEEKVTIDRVYVDEAQEIGDEDRGMILHSAVREVIIRFPQARICFASPLTANPGYLLNEFEITAQGEFFTERQTPVSQTVILLDEVKGKTKAIDVSVRTPIGPQMVGRIETQYQFRGVMERLAHTAVTLTKPGESTIVYANRASDAMDIATDIAELIEEKVEDKEVDDLVEFVKAHIHSLYALVDTLPKGVAFHYGKMPHLIRGQVESLLRRRKIRYVVSTSTLLQGINLPATNIFILEPRKGNDRPMRSPDFWNLAGRAGRLKETFNGNIWCLNPKSWEGDPVNGHNLADIRSSFRMSLEDGAVREAVEAVLDKQTPLSTVMERDRVEQLLGKVFAEFTCQDTQVSNSHYAADADKGKLAQIDAKCEDLRTRLKVPADVCKRNSVISPMSLDDLWGRFAKAQSIESYIPVDPSRTGALDRMRALFQVIDEVFIGSGNNSWRYFAALAYYWIRGSTLKDMIANHLAYNKVPAERKETNRAIRGFLESLEQTLRFTYVKYLKAYIDTLEVYLTVTKQEELKKGIAPLHMYIEYGAKDLVLIMLMSLGLSRTTAIFVRTAVTQQSEISRNDCWNRLQQLPLKVLNIPEVCKAEVRQLTGQAS